MPEGVENQGDDQDPIIDDAADDVADEGDDDLPVGDEGDDVEEGADPDSTDDASAAGTNDQPAISRRTARVQKLEKERDTERTRAAELQGRLDGILAMQRQAQPDDAAQRAEAARVAAMDPAERERYEDKQRIEALSRQVANLAHSQEDNLDRARFEMRLEHEPALKKYADSVEKALGEMRTKGVNSSREAILKYKLGEEAYDRLMSKKGAEQRKQAAQKRVASVNGRPANVRGDNTGGGKGKTEEDRLRGVQI